MSDHPTVTQVDALAKDLLEDARQQNTKRASRTLVTGTSQRVTLIALAEGAELREHGAPHAAATLFVVVGRVRLHTHDDVQVLEEGQLAAVPFRRNGLTADTDAAVLLTVALR